MKNFTTSNDFSLIAYTSMQGAIDASYDELVAVFGEPNDGTDKTDAEWIVLFSDGTIATIYNYKDGKNYLGEAGDDVSIIRDWHIGGKNATAVIAVTNEVNAYRAKEQSK